MKSIWELTSEDTTTSDVRGSSRTAYALEPTQWVKQIIDAAKRVHYYAQFAYQGVVSPGNKDLIIPYRTAYLASGDWQASVGEATAVNFTKINNLDGVNISPSDVNAGVAISNRALRVNALDLVRAAKEELTYHAGDLVDLNVRNTAGDATAAGSATRGAQTIYGGDARADSELATGDTFTVDMIVDGKIKLQSATCKYWVPGTPAAEAVSSQSKNPWKNEPSSPFVLMIAPEQEGVLLKDSQFTNASEYGSNKVIMNGEIGEYMKIKIVSSNNCESFAAGATAPDGGGVTGAIGHRCLMFKSKKAFGLAWGLKPKLHVFPYPSELESRMVLELAYASATIHDDATVNIDVADT